jgi:hypothetical protein
MFMGIDVDAEQFASFSESFARKFCPFCSCEHTWHKKDAKLVDRRPACAVLRDLDWGAVLAAHFTAGHHRT